VALPEVLPERGRIGIFNRSYYEEVLVVRVHGSCSSGRRCRGPGEPEDLGGAPGGHLGVRALSGATGHILLKFFLHVSARTEAAVPAAPGNAGEELEIFLGRRYGARLLADYMAAYEDAIRSTASVKLRGT